MSSFDVGCGISNLAIHENDKVGFVILGASRDIRYHDVEGVGKSSYGYTTSLYAPYAPPVFGNYADSGQIKEIKKSETTELLSDIFKRPIEDIIECIASERTVYNEYGPIFEHYGDSDFIERFNSKGPLSVILEEGTSSPRADFKAMPANGHSE